MNAEHFKALMRHIQNSFEESGERLSSELQFASPSGVISIAQSVLPKDDSSLQWSPSGSGRTDDPAQALEKLFNRMVMRYEDKQASSNRTDDDVWRHFKKDLEGQRILQYFQPKIISVQDDEIEFQHSWKNGKWHCLEPISFDMATADNIREKAHRWMGQLASVQGATDRFKVYLLIGAPQQESLQPAFLRAMSMLKRIPGENEIVLEKDALDLAARIAGEVAEHERID